jgi:hypothetical protein
MTDAKNDVQGWFWDKLSAIHSAAQKIIRDHLKSLKK